MSNLGGEPRPRDYHHEVNQNYFPDLLPFDKWGYNDAIGTLGYKTCWSYPSADLTILSNAEYLDITFDHASDQSGGTGMTGVILYGPGEDWVNQIEVVLATAGTVRTTKKWQGINRMSGYSYGSGGLNAGPVTATAVTSSVVQAYIPTGKGSTQQAFFFVPAGYTGQFEWMTINAVKLSGGGQPVITTRGRVFSTVSNGWYEVFEDQLDTANSDFHPYEPRKPFPIGEKSVFVIENISDTASSKANVRFSVIATRNN